MPYLPPTSQARRTMHLNVKQMLILAYVLGFILAFLHGLYWDKYGEF